MGKSRSTKATLVYPQHHWLNPADLLHFIELKSFEHDWDAYGFPDEELGRLQIEIMLDPKRAPVIPGTDGLRKIRYSPSVTKTGKRGRLRVCYVYFEEFYTVLLVVVYAKNANDNLKASEKTAINDAIARIGAALRRKFEEG